MNSQPTVAEYFDAKAATWDDMPCHDDAKHIAVAVLAGVEQGSRVLDLGCGTGIMAPAYLAAGAARVLGVDVAPGMIARASEKFAGESRVDFACCDAIDLEAGETFDRVVIYNAYPHFMDKAALITAITRVLAPQGRFLVAHGAGRDIINQHHHGAVPHCVTSDLDSAKAESRLWMRNGFDIDVIIDTPDIYAFGGVYLG